MTFSQEKNENLKKMFILLAVIASLTLSTGNASAVDMFDFDSVDEPEFAFFVDENGTEQIVDVVEHNLIETMLAQFNEKTRELTENTMIIDDTRANQIQPVTMVLLAQEDILIAQFNAAARETIFMTLLLMLVY